MAAALGGKPLQDAFRTSFAKQVVPAFEGATQVMFQQINTAFSAGLEEHLQVGLGGWVGGCWVGNECADVAALGVTVCCLLAASAA